MTHTPWSSQICIKKMSLFYSQKNTLEWFGIVIMSLFYSQKNTLGWFGIVINKTIFPTASPTSKKVINFMDK